MSDEDWEHFSAAISLLKEGKELLFRDVIRAATGHKILPFDESTRAVRNSIENWIHDNISELSQLVESEYKGRINDLGNWLEQKVKDKLNDNLEIECETPKTADGKSQSSGYPDAIIKSVESIIYSDVKVLQSDNIDSTLRSFYYQPTNKSKIHHDAPHFLISFEVEAVEEKNVAPFRIVDLHIIDLYDLTVEFKAEFNSNNKNIYS